MEEDADLRARALAAPEGPTALALWIELGARGDTEAAERLREYARCDEAALCEPARAALEAMELSHDDPMP